MRWSYIAERLDESDGAALTAGTMRQMATRGGLRSSGRIVLLLTAIGACALALRLYGIGDKSIWLDEAWSWRAAKLPFADMLEWTADDRHPPLYYAVLSAFVDLLGDSEFVLRMPSAIAGTATAVLLGWVGWRGGGWLLAALSGGLLAIHPTHIEFAQEARMYPLMGLLVLASTVALAAIIERPSPWRSAGYAVVAAAMLYTHYSGALVIGLHLALVMGFAFARRHEGGEKIALFGIASVVFAALAFAPWYSHFFDSASEGVGHLPPASWRLVDLVAAALFGLQRAEDLWLAIALPLTAFGAYGAARRGNDPFVVCVAALALMPVSQFAITWLRTPVLDARQASPFTAGYVFVLAMGLIEAQRYVADVLDRDRMVNVVVVAGAALLGAVMIFGVRDWYRSGPREDWRAAAALVEERGGGAIVWRTYVDVPLRYYTDAPLAPAQPGSPPAVGARTLVLSHHAPEEETAILTGISSSVTVGEATELPGVVIVPLLPRSP